jgi:hypothetical protein
MGKQKFYVYEYEHKGSKSHYSKGVKRDFGENRVVFVDGHQILCSVQPLHDANGLKLIGHLYA